MVALLPVYPSDARGRKRWILDQRPMRNKAFAERPYAFHHEMERSASGDMVSVATIFLTNRECPWQCVMCDLWRNTVTETISDHAIPRQIAYALSQLPPATHVKLYNSGSFFDPRAVPPSSYSAIAALTAPFERVIVESHPSLINHRCLHFHDLVKGRLEVAMGLETAHPVALEKLNKHISTETFAQAALRLRDHSIPLRSFVLVHPPFIAPEEAAYWTNRSIDFAFHCESTAVSLIPTRTGNGAMERLMMNGDFVPPTLRSLEDAADYGILLKHGRVFADLWDIERLALCSTCGPARIARLRSLNDLQRPLDRISCNAHCEDA